MRPRHLHTEHVRVACRYDRDATQRRDGSREVVVDVSNGVPQHVPGRGLQKQCALPDADFRRYRHSEKPNFDILDGATASFRAEFLEGCPPLAGGGQYVLTLVAADPADRRRADVSACSTPQVRQIQAVIADSPAMATQDDGMGGPVAE